MPRFEIYQESYFAQPGKRFVYFIYIYYSTLFILYHTIILLRGNRDLFLRQNNYITFVHNVYFYFDPSTCISFYSDSFDFSMKTMDFCISTYLIANNVKALFCGPKETSLLHCLWTEEQRVFLSYPVMMSPLPLTLMSLDIRYNGYNSDFLVL